MRTIIKLICGVLTVLLPVSLVAMPQTQDREQYLVSAKAGGINLVSGDVMVTRQGVPQPQPLTSQDDLNNGDVVSTGLNSRVEVLLSPGSYFRAAENSEFELTDTSLDAVRVKLTRGSAVVEAAGADEARLSIQVVTASTKVAIDRKGLYRINTLPEGVTEVLVRKGEAVVGGDQSTAIKIKDGKKATATGGRIVAAKFDKEYQDDFDLWSKQRAETLVAVNRSLSKQTIANSFSIFRASRWGQLGGYGSFAGLWIYDPFYRCRTFLPFYSGWSSPYGHGYSRGFGFSWNPHRHNLSNTRAGLGPSRSGATAGTRGGAPAGSGGGQTNRRRDDLGRQPHSKSAHRAPSHAPSHSSGHRRH